MVVLQFRRIIDVPVKKLVMSMSMRRCLRNRTDGAWRRLGGKEFHAATFLQTKGDNSTLNALGGLRRYGERGLDDSFGAQMVKTSVFNQKNFHLTINHASLN
jgi:hypothetical protein